MGFVCCDSKPLTVSPARASIRNRAIGMIFAASSKTEARKQTNINCIHLCQQVRQKRRALANGPESQAVIQPPAKLFAKTANRCYQPTRPLAHSLTVIANSTSKSMHHISQKDVLGEDLGALKVAEINRKAALSARIISGSANAADK